MWFDGIRKENTMYVASVSRGKDSTAMLRAIQLMGWPLDAIVSVDIWFDETTPAELPPMVAFKDEWDRKCAEWFGVPVTRLTAARKRESADSAECHSRNTYCWQFYQKLQRRKESAGGGQYKIEAGEHYYGFPVRSGAWCNSRLKVSALQNQNILRYVLQTDFRKEATGQIDGLETGSQDDRRQHDIGVSAQRQTLVQRRTQAGGIFKTEEPSFLQSPRTRGRK